MKKILPGLLLAALALLAVLPMIHADVPTQMSYQGYLTDAQGRPMDHVHSLAFAIYDAETDGTLLWSELHPDVEVVDGLFSVILGTRGEPLDNKVFESSSTWLEIHVDGRLIEPRTQLTSVGYAQRVSTVDGAAGGVVSGNVTVTGRLTPDDGVVRNGAIRIQSLGDSVLIVAGTSHITINQAGVVSISSMNVEITATQDLTLSADNTLTLHANEIYADADSYMRLNSYYDMDVEASVNMNLEATNIDAQAHSNLDLEGSAGTHLSSPATTNITGSLVTIN